MRWRIMHTMKETHRNPIIRVYPHSRRKLRLLAAYYGQTIQDTVERLASQELERLGKEGKLDVPGETGEHRQDSSTR